jgi:hypothetical protein
MYRFNIVMLFINSRICKCHKFYKFKSKYTNLQYTYNIYTYVLFVLNVLFICISYPGGQSKMAILLP